jgi:hypothetical protein
MVVPLFVVYMALDTLGLRDHKKRVDHAAQ